MPIPLSSRVRRKESVYVQTLADGEAILLDMNSEEYYSLNDSGRYMWQLLDTLPSIDAALEELVRQVSDVDAETLKRDLSEFVDVLNEHEFIDVQTEADDAETG